MKKLRIDVSKPYDVIIEKGLFGHLQDYLQCEKILVITDSNVLAIYKDKLKSVLEKCSKDYYIYEIEAGEKSKNLDNFGKILEYAASKKISRKDVFVSFGGGVCGDLCGFCAACFLRGVDYIQIPTTLLSAVDSSVGGKTAVDLEHGKNLCGCFYQPKIVLCDPELLNTLADDIYSDGMAEVIKYAFLNENNLRNTLLNKNFDIEDVIYTCVDIKRQFVTTDEFDKGLRQMLNFGHTFAHAYEALSHFNISHGKAVSMGMFAATAMACNNDLCDIEVLYTLTKLLKMYNLPLKVSDIGYKFDNKDIFDVMLNDKKCFGNLINLIIPKGDRGVCEICPVETLKLSEFLNGNMGDNV